MGKKLFWWHEVMSRYDAITLCLEAIDVMHEIEGVNADKITLCRGKKCFLDGMQVRGNEAVVWYNNFEGSTKAAVVKIKKGILNNEEI